MIIEGAEEKILLCRATKVSGFSMFSALRIVIECRRRIRIRAAAYHLGDDDCQENVIKDAQDQTHTDDLFRNHRRSVAQGERSASRQAESRDRKRLCRLRWRSLCPFSASTIYSLSMIAAAPILPPRLCDKSVGEDEGAWMSARTSAAVHWRGQFISRGI